MSFQGAITDMDAAKARAEDLKARRRLRIEHIQRLERVLPVPAPPALWQARNTARLHDALLDWEADLLDEVAQHRVAYDDTHDD